jgi:hypothetical protein
MTTQHTPGPWFVIDGHYPSFKEISGPSFKINVVMWATDLDEDDYRKRHADLHLIAAAPDLLKAAKTIMENLDGMAGEVTAGYHESIIAPLRDAIAKATGDA